MEKNPNAVVLGRLGGSVKGGMKAISAQWNGARGGRLPNLVRQVMADVDLPLRSAGAVTFEYEHKASIRGGASRRRWRWYVAREGARPETAAYRATSRSGARPSFKRSGTVVELIVTWADGKGTVELAFDGRLRPKGSHEEARLRFDAARTMAALSR